MMQARVPQTLLAALMAFAAAGAASAADPRGGAAPVAYDGSYSVTLHVTLASPLPPGATLLCRAKAAPNAPFFQSRVREIFPMQRVLTAQQAGASITPAGSTANCTVEIPFSWIGQSEISSSGINQSGMEFRRPSTTELSYEISAVSASSGWAAPTRVQTGIGVALPPSGGVANLSFNVSF